MRKRPPGAQTDCQPIARSLGAVCWLHWPDGYGQRPSLKDRWGTGRRRKNGCFKAWTGYEEKAHRRALCAPAVSGRRALLDRHRERGRWRDPEPRLRFQLPRGFGHAVTSSGARKRHGYTPS